MKVTLAAVVLAILPSLFAAPLPPLEHVGFAGNEYARLKEWAETADLQMKWSRGADAVVLSNSSARLEFTIDSRRAEIDGVSVWLSLPVVNRSGVPLVSIVDLRTTLEPILHPKHSEAALGVICLDPGHGGKDKGEISGANYEKKYALLLAEETERALESNGFKVVLTRSNDTFIELSERPLTAHRRGADLFVSLHYNSAEASVRGIEVFCLAPPGVNSSDQGGGAGQHPAEAGNDHDDRNALLAFEMQKSLIHSLPMEDRGMKRSRFEVLREARTPAILVEGGFMSNPEDGRRIYDAAFRKRMAEAVVNGVLAYRRALEKAP